jgi:hypothetical protein
MLLPWPERGIMRRYYFDIRDGDILIPDEDGLQLTSSQAAQEEAARSLGGLLRDAARPARDGQGSHIAIEVRDDKGPLMQLKFSLDKARYAN